MATVSLNVKYFGRNILQNLHELWMKGHNASDTMGHRTDREK